MQLTRRDTTRLILASSAALAIPTSGLAQSDRRFVRRLQQELNDHLIPGCDGEFIVARFGRGSRDDKNHLAAVIELHWPPGFRRRRFDASGDNVRGSYRGIVNQALFEFGKAWPGCVV